MAKPKGQDISDFSRHLIRELILKIDAKIILNPVVEFSHYLEHRGFEKDSSCEFSERNSNNLLLHIAELREEWTNLGVKLPFSTVSNKVITWRHPNFRKLAQQEPISPTYPTIIKNIRDSNEDTFLGYLSCYLFAIGCKKIYITDGPHDGGIDLIGSYGKGNSCQEGIFIQAKTASGINIKKDLLLAEYSKFLLLKKLPKWNEYIKACGLSHSISGFSPIYLFITNAELRTGVRDAARQLEVGLRSGRQIASVLSEFYTLPTLERVVETLSPYEMNLSINIADTISRITQSDEKD